MKKINVNKEFLKEQAIKGLEKTHSVIEYVGDNPGKAAVGILGAAAISVGLATGRKLTKSNNRGLYVINTTLARAVHLGSNALIAAIATTQIGKWTSEDEEEKDDLDEDNSEDDEENDDLDEE